jgi:hypothetical protein
MIPTKGLAKVYLVFFLVFVFNALRAQTRYQQFTLGGGAGAATAYAGAAQIQTNAAFYTSACYYPATVFNIELEGQAGVLSGVSPYNSRNLKSFSNSYRAVILDANLYLGVFFDPQKSAFLNVIKDFYGGIGYGIMANSINNTDITSRNTIDHVNNTLKIIPIKGGYEYNIIRNKYNEPVLKADLSASFYYVNAKGLDGYYDNYAKASSFFTYYAIGLKYTIIIRTPYGRGYNKFD